MIMASLSVHLNVKISKQRTMLLSHLQMKLYSCEVKTISLHVLLKLSYPRFPFTLIDFGVMPPKVFLATVLKRFGVRS